MDGWDWETGWSRDALKRIVALLFALANLADLAAGAPYLRRRRVLGILSHGEIEARAFVIGMATGAAISVDALETTGDAARLAVRLRALALVLCVLLTQAARFTTPGAAGPLAGGHKISAPAARWLDAAAPPAFDTS
jgi:hypothetical protein